MDKHVPHLLKSAAVVGKEIRLIRNIWLHHNMNFVTNKNSLDISQFVTRILSEFTEPNKDKERVILQ